MKFPTMTKYICFISLVCLVLSCTDKSIEPDIYGDWNTEDWYVQQDSSSIDQRMQFSFDTIGRYIVDYGTITEEGTFWIQYGMLYTREDGQTEKSVKILHLDADSLALLMNRSGQAEVIILGRPE